MTVRVLERPKRTFGTQIYLVEVWRGLAITFRHLFVNLFRHAMRALGVAGFQPGAVTIQYPEDPAVLGKRARTRHRLLKRDDGAPRCTACLLCETVCPAKCIRITAENAPDKMVEKRAKSFDIDMGMCVYCGYCVEVCPVDAIHMDANDVELSAYSRQDMIWNMKELLGDAPKVPSKPVRFG
ncbi:MAG: NADH-quinone oxidoreductase subunit I [Elusimicrobiota bacterium]|nr:NADH-quinone oxidoreductase subunit I [Elusimicrobiota bacterium]